MVITIVIFSQLADNLLSMFIMSPISTIYIKHFSQCVCWLYQNFLVVTYGPMIIALALDPKVLVSNAIMQLHCR